MRLQYVVVQRGEPPVGLRITTEGWLERTTADNPPPTETDRLELDRSLTWQPDHQLAAETIERFSHAIEESGFFDLEPRLLINYCKEDPGVGIWEIEQGGMVWRVVVYDPRPRRAPAIDRLLAALDSIM